MQTIQQVLGENKLKKYLKSLYRVGKITKDKNRPIMIKLDDVASKHRRLKLKNLKIMNDVKETNAYINPDRTIIELKAFRILRK